jgi:carnitine 3-dehydrogenase
MYRDTNRIQQVAVVGTGTIGASWATYFLARGLDVIAVEPVAAVHRRLRSAMEHNWIALEAAGLVRAGASIDRLIVTKNVDALAEQRVDFVQENVHEHLDLKQATLRSLDAILPPDVIIASSTSGLKASDLQDGCTHPERVLVGHPMNPPHLIPLVEIVGGRRSADAALQAAVNFYAAIGKRPVLLNKEVIGHLATRLTVALWREAALLVQNGVASVQDVDAAVTHGLGLRMAVAGPHLSYHMGGGEAGLAGFFGWAREPLRQWCADLGTIKIDSELETVLVEGVTAATSGRSVQELATRRDEALAIVLRDLHGS